MLDIIYHVTSGNEAGLTRGYYWHNRVTSI